MHRHHTVWCACMCTLGEYVRERHIHVASTPRKQNLSVNKNPSYYLTGRSGRCKRRRARAILQGEVRNENDQLRKRAPHFGAGALQEVFREAIGNVEKDVMRKPKAHILAVTEENAQGIIPKIKKKQEVFMKSNSRTCFILQGRVSLNQIKNKKPFTAGRCF